MSTRSGRVWTRTNNGWATREPNEGDHWRRAIVAAWMQGETVIDNVTKMARLMTYADAARDIKSYSITEAECAP